MNHIAYFKNDIEEIIDNQDEMCNVAVDYFKGIFTGGGNIIPQELNPGSRVISDTQNANLTKKLEFDEFTKAVKQMHPDKSSGPEGFSPTCFQHFWGLLGREIFESCKSWLRECSFPPELNHTILVLIP